MESEQHPLEQETSHFLVCFSLTSCDELDNFLWRAVLCRSECGGTSATSAQSALRRLCVRIWQTRAQQCETIRSFKTKCLLSARGEKVDKNRGGGEDMTTNRGEKLMLKEKTNPHGSILNKWQLKLNQVKSNSRQMKVQKVGISLYQPEWRPLRNTCC